MLDNSVIKYDYGVFRKELKQLLKIFAFCQKIEVTSALIEKTGSKMFQLRSSRDHGLEQPSISVFVYYFILGRSKSSSLDDKIYIP